MKQHTPFTRSLCYSFGMALLALGLTLTAETQLGASALTAIPFVLSLKFSISFADATLVLFITYVTVQLVLKWDRKAIIPILLQIPLSILFTWIMRITQNFINIADLPFSVRFSCLVLAIILTGVGAAMTLKMKLVPNPGDGFVQSIAEKTGKSLGLTKNIVDIVSVLTAALLSLILIGKIDGVGIGSVLAMLGVGRVISLYNRLTKNFELVS